MTNIKSAKAKAHYYSRINGSVTECFEYAVREDNTVFFRKITKKLNGQIVTGRWALSAVSQIEYIDGTLYDYPGRLVKIGKSLYHVTTDKSKIARLRLPKN